MVQYSMKRKRVEILQKKCFTLPKDDCTLAKNFGYPEGSPCILIKLNKIYNWYPEPYEVDYLPEDLPEVIRDKILENNKTNETIPFVRKRKNKLFYSLTFTYRTIKFGWTVTASILQIKNILDL